MTKNMKIVKFIAIAIALISVAVGWRIINNTYAIAPNLELVTTATVLAAIVLDWRGALIVPIASMIVSDLFIGNSSIFMFTWSAFTIIGIGALLLRKLNNKPKSQILASAGFAVASSFAFFVITNFGVWSQGWYTMTFAGLVECFTMAIPFYRTMLIGNIILVPAAVAVYQFVRVKATSNDLVVDSLVR
jgi:hypothetical protein